MKEIAASGLAAFLRRAAFDLELPFACVPPLPRLPVGKKAPALANGRLVCRRRLRLLPGRRLVCTGEWCGRAVVVKFYCDPLKARRHWRRERAGLKALAAAGLATPELLLAWPPERLGGVAGLILAELEDARTLLELWCREKDAERRYRALAAVTETVADHHRAGLLQKDIHWGNFLFSQGRVYTIDGDAVCVNRAGRELGRAAGRDNLALFLAEPVSGIETYIAALWRVYCARRGWNPRPGESAELAAAVRGRLFAKAEKFVAKVGRDCSAVLRRREPRRLLLVERHRLTPALEEILARPDTFIAGGEILKAGNSATVVRVRHQGLDLVLKRYNIKHPGHALRRALRPTRAWHSWRNAQCLRWWNIAVPAPVAMLERRCFGLRSVAWFISDYVAGEAAACLLPRLEPESPELAGWLERFAQLLRLLRDLGISHGDFKATNFLCGADGCLYLLDLDAMRCWKRPGAAFARAVARDYRRLLANWREQPWLEERFREMMG